MFYNFRKNKKAFTLVELIVVIAIIAILGAVVGVTVSTFVKRAQRTAATEPLNQLAEMWSNKEDGQTLKDYIKELLPDDYGSVKVSDNSQLSKKSGFGTFTIYFHDDNCKDYYGVLTVTSGKPAKSSEAKDDSSTVTAWNSATAVS